MPTMSSGRDVRTERDVAREVLHRLTGARGHAERDQVEVELRPEVGFHDARGKGVHRDAMRGQRPCAGLGQADDRGLAGAIGRPLAVTAAPRDGGVLIIRPLCPDAIIAFAASCMPIITPSPLTFMIWFQFSSVVSRKFWAG